MPYSPELYAAECQERLQELDLAVREAAELASEDDNARVVHDRCLAEMRLLQSFVGTDAMGSETELLVFLQSSLKDAEEWFDADPAPLDTELFKEEWVRLIGEERMKILRHGLIAS